jgi:hypothetical protein
VRTSVDERPKPIVQPRGRGRVEPIVAPEIVRTGEGCEARDELKRLRPSLVRGLGYDDETIVPMDFATGCAKVSVDA